MNSSLQFISTNGMSETDWLAYRSSGLGASEISAVLGLNPYKSSIELFYEKIGMYPKISIENIAMFMGTEQEAFVANLWQYWGGNEESLIENYRNKNLIRKCQRVNAYVRNPEYPHLFVSLDRKINKHGDKDEGALEIKTISGYEADKWEGGIPPSHIMQLQTQLMVCMFDYGELAVLRDGRRFEVFQFEKMQSVCDTIAEKTAEFWERVETAKKLVNGEFEARRGFKYKLADELKAEIEQLEPDPDGSQSYANYLKEKYKTSRGERIGIITDKENARLAKSVSEQIKKLTEEKTEYENRLKKSMGEVQTLDLGVNGKVHWSVDVKGGRRFLNKYKE